MVNIFKLNVKTALKFTICRVAGVVLYSSFLLFMLIVNMLRRSKNKLY